MKPLNHPFDILKRYVIAHEDGGIGWDKSYALIFTTEGRIVVRTFKDYEQPHKTPDVDELDPKDFATVKVKGVPLREIVVNKLREILPDSN